jgi:hypothetical protein
MFRRDIGRTGNAEYMYPWLPERGSIVGVVTCDGQPVDGATITAEGPGNPPEERTTASVSNGKYMLTILKPGTWSVEASYGGHTDDDEVIVEAGIQYRVDLDLE